MNPAGNETLARRDGHPRLADGVELIGEYEGSGYIEPPTLARRADGQVVQLSNLLYLVAEHADGDRSADEIASAVTAASGREVSGDNVRQLLEEKLTPLGLVTNGESDAPAVDKANPLLALRFRVAVADEAKTRFLTSIFKPLFLPPVVLAVMAGFVAMDVWVFGVHGVAQSTRELMYQPMNMLLVLGLTVVSAGFHEFGHAAALRYGGGTPGVMGAGVYVVWPAFYTDVTDAYRLDRRARLRTDLGGVYFNVVFALVTFGAYALTGAEVLLLIIPLQHLQMLHQLLPLLRLDGYFILADLTGVPDLFARIKPVLSSMVPGRKKDDRVTALKPWVRRVVTGWVLVIVPVLLYALALMVISLPRIAATAWDSAGVQLDKVSGGFADGDPAAAVVAILSLILLLLPVTGAIYTLVRLTTRVLSGGWNATSQRPVLRALFIGAALAVAAGTLWQWLPNGEYKPIQRNERGTVAESIRALRDLQTGRPGLTSEREREIGGAGFVSSPVSPEAAPEGSETDDATTTSTTAGTATDEGTEPTDESTTEESTVDATTTTVADATTTTSP